MDKPRPLHVAIKSRQVRGHVYLRTLAEVGENRYQFGIGTSPVAKRSAIQHSRRLLASMDPEQWQALADMRVPDAYLGLLGSTDATLQEEALLFFEEAERVLLPPGEHCHAGLACPVCSRFRSHHTPRGVQLLSGIAMSPILKPQLKQAAVRVLVDVAKAYGLPPQRQALGALIQLLQMQRPRDDFLTASLQPYTRTRLIEALETPTPALVHAMYCYPASWSLLGIAKSNVCQPGTVEDVTEQVQLWLYRARETAQVGKQVNWLAVIPLVAWARHLAHLDNMSGLIATVQALLAVYKEAFLHAEMPCFQQPSQSGGMSSAVWDTQNQSDKDSRTAGAMRFMVEFIGFIEIVFLRFGPAPVQSSVEVFIDELKDPGLAETPWYFQVLHLFGTLTAHMAPWIRQCRSGDADLRLKVAGLAANWREKVGDSPQGLHPSTWSIDRWYQELYHMGFGKAFVRALQDALLPARVVLRRPKWTATLLTLMRVIWHNIVSVRSTSSFSKKPMTTSSVRTDHCQADVLVFELQGAIRFLMDDCIASSMGESLSHIESSVSHDDRITALLDLRGLAISLLEEIARRGRQHLVLVHSITLHVTKQFVDMQHALLLSPILRLRVSASRLFRMLLDLKAPEIDVILQQSGVPAQLRAVGSDEAHREDHLLGSGESQSSSHPLALHRHQIGELVGGFNGPKPTIVMYPESTTVPKAAAKPKPKTDVVVSRIR